MADDLVAGVRRKASALPAEGVPVVRRARQRALVAAEAVAAALAVDPTLAEPDRCRDIDLLDEVVRQLRPLARQAELAVERRRLAEGAQTAETARQIARLGRTNPLAADELEALSQRAVEVAGRIADSARPDWHTPRRVRERSEDLLPSEHELAEIADRLRAAVQPSLALPHPAAEAVRLAALADQITAPRERRRSCEGPGCDEEIEPAVTGRPRR